MEKEDCEMETPEPRPEITITFRALPDRHNTPVSVRIRALLKTALRRDRLKCLRVEGLPPEQKQDVDKQGEQ